MRTSFVGFDNRISTSKVIALLWTVVVAYFVLTLTIIAVHRGTDGLWSALLGTISGTYLVLLGGPFAAAVGAKLVVTARTPQNLQKSVSTTKPSLFDIISDDDSNLDLVDTQYTLFNLVALAAVLVLFIRRPGAGVPDVPSFLAVLTGAGAGTYLVNKAVQTNTPTITSIQPTSAAVGDPVIISGANLLSPGGDARKAKVSVGGFPATVSADTASTTQMTITVPPPTGGLTYPTPARIVLTTDAGATVTTQDLDTELTVVTPALNSLAAQSVPQGGQIVAQGTSLLPSADKDENGKLSSAGPEATLTPKDGGDPTTLTCDTTAGAVNNDSTLTYKVLDDQAVGDYTFTLARPATSQNVTIIPAGPHITTIDPHTGPVAGTTAVTVTGKALDEVNGVLFGKVLAPVTQRSATQVTAIAPPMAGGQTTVAVTATTDDGKTPVPAADNQYRYAPLPTVTNLQPASGSAAAQTWLTITGTGFLEASVVSFSDGTTAAPAIVSDVMISAVLPAGQQGPVTVSVTTPGGTSAITDAAKFTRE